MFRFLPLLAAVGLDLWLGDPVGWPHVVVAMGKTIAGLEALLRRIFPATPAGLTAAGAVLALVTPALFCAGGWAALALCRALNPWLGFAAEALLCWQCLAARTLRDAGVLVWRALTGGTLQDARAAVGRIVGRDTAALDAPGVIRAAVESVAESTGDGVIAPMLYCFVGGAPLGLLYKAVNTMDSMVGYHNDRYEYFGKCAARLDDLANLIPARLSGLLLVAAAFLCGGDGPNAWRIFRRDRRSHKSPNSAHGESAVAGALHIRLGGDACYFGRLVHKQTLGDDDRPPCPDDILKTNRLMLCASALCLALCGAVWGVLL